MDNKDLGRFGEQKAAAFLMSEGYRILNFNYQCRLGEIDIIKCGIDNVEQYIGTIGYNKTEYKTRDYDFLSFNTQSELFSDKAVRKAISLGIDKPNLVASCFGTGYRDSNFFFDYESWLFDNKLNVVSVDGYRLAWKFKELQNNNDFTAVIPGRSLNEIVSEGIQAKLSMLPDQTKYKLSQTITKMVNKGSNNLIAIVL